MSNFADSPSRIFNCPEFHALGKEQNFVSFPRKWLKHFCFLATKTKRWWNPKFPCFQRNVPKLQSVKHTENLVIWATNRKYNNDSFAHFQVHCTFLIPRECIKCFCFVERFQIKQPNYPTRWSKTLVQQCYFSIPCFELTSFCQIVV